MLNAITDPTGTHVAQSPSASPRFRSGNQMVTHDGAATPISPMPTPSRRRLTRSSVRFASTPPSALPTPRQATESKMTFFSPTRRAMKAAGKASTTPIRAIALMSVPNVTESNVPWNAGKSHDAKGGILNWQSGAQMLAKYVTASIPHALPLTLDCLAMSLAVNSVIILSPRMRNTALPLKRVSMLQGAARSDVSAGSPTCCCCFSLLAPYAQGGTQRYC